MPRPGQLLLAAPTLPQPFEHAVVLVVEHDESGSLGVVLNEPSTLDVGQVLPAWRSAVVGSPVVHVGGPVAPDSALALAAVIPPHPDHGESTPAEQADDEPPGFRRVSGPVGLVDLDADVDRLAPHLAAMRIFAGYAGWSPGQLDRELREGSWAVADLVDPVPEVFGTDSDHLWEFLVRRQPGMTSWWVTCPRDPGLN